MGNYEENIAYLTDSTLFLVLGFLGYFQKETSVYVYELESLFAIICIYVQNVIFHFATPPAIFQ